MERFIDTLMRGPETYPIAMFPERFTNNLEDDRIYLNVRYIRIWEIFFVTKCLKGILV